MSIKNTIMQGEYRSSFGGTDIQAVIGNNVVGTLQAISYSITREKGPIYTMSGRPDPHSFARGKRAIAGNLVFLTIDQQAFLQHMKEHADIKFYGSKKSVKYSYGNEDLLSDKNNLFLLFQENAVNTPNFNELTDGKGVGYERQEMDAWYADQVLPFDVNLTAANEYGQAMKKSFVGVEILNEGGGVSIDDLVIEEAYTYICRGMTKWTKVLDPGQQIPTSK